MNNSDYGKFIGMPKHLLNQPKFPVQATASLTLNKSHSTSGMRASEAPNNSRKLAQDFTKQRLQFAQDKWEHRQGNYLLQE